MGAPMPYVSPRRIRSDLYSLDEALPPPPPPSLLSVLSSLLNRLVSRTERQHSSSPSPPMQSLVFYGLRAPAIGIQQYLERIFKYANCSPSCFVVAYAYIDRLIQQQPEFRICSLTVHRLLITSVMLSAKFLDDIYYDNAYYAKIGGITTQEINKLEVEFLFLLDFRMQVTVSVFESYCSHLEREVALGGGYQIERTLRSICGLDGGAPFEKPTDQQPPPPQQQRRQHYQQQQQRREQQQLLQRRAMAVRCSDGS